MSENASTTTPPWLSRNSIGARNRVADGWKPETRESPGESARLRARFSGKPFAKIELFVSDADIARDGTRLRRCFFLSLYARLSADLPLVR